MSNGTTELERPVPLYMQVVRQLRAQIASGELADGDRIPSQRQMMARWHISMQTASKVIGALKTERLAIPSVGRDTIVAPGAAARLAAASTGTAHAPAEPPPAPGTGVTATAGKTAAPAHVAEILGIPPGRRALHRRETRTDDSGQTISITITWYPPAIADKAPRLADDQPLPAGTLAYIAEATTAGPPAPSKTTAPPPPTPTAATLGIQPAHPSCHPHPALHRHGQLIEYAEASPPRALAHPHLHDHRKLTAQARQCHLRCQAVARSRAWPGFLAFDLPGQSVAGAWLSWYLNVRRQHAQACRSRAPANTTAAGLEPSMCLLGRISNRRHRQVTAAFDLPASLCFMPQAPCRPSSNTTLSERDSDHLHRQGYCHRRDVAAPELWVASRQVWPASDAVKFLVRLVRGGVHVCLATVAVDCGRSAGGAPGSAAASPAAEAPASSRR